MAQLENIEAIEKRLWTAADTLRTNSNYASNEYFIPVMGLIFLRHAYSRNLAVRDDIVKNLPIRGGKTRALTKEDFSQKGAIFLKENAQFDYLVALTDAHDRAEAVIAAMESIEKDYQNLKDQLPKAEYRELDNTILGQLLRTLNPEELHNATGDIFGRIYEYFLTGFADLKAHDSGEFFTPISLVQLIANVIEPDHGRIMDPACGSGGMFVQSAHFVERLKKNPGKVLTFYGKEKNPTTIRLAKMNLAVHGLEGNIQKDITYYSDPDENLAGTFDFVMANPPFNTDEVDAEKVKNDIRLPFGLPGVNKKKKVSNGNYLWISYFYSYLNEKGRAGFVMSSQASSAGGEEAKVRKTIIETGDVDLIIDIRGNFFYTRSVPCQLWFFNRNKPIALKDKVLMIDARNVFRKVTRKIYDFSPEQQKNLTAIVWLYRGQQQRFLDLVKSYITQTLAEAGKCFKLSFKSGESNGSLAKFLDTFKSLVDAIAPFFTSLEANGPHSEFWQELNKGQKHLEEEQTGFEKALEQAQNQFQQQEFNKVAGLLEFVDGEENLSALAQKSRSLSKQIDLVFKYTIRLIDLAEKELNAKESELWDGATINGARKNNLKKEIDNARKLAVEQLKQVRYFHKQAHWLLSRFSEGELRDVEGLVKMVDKSELEANDWSMTPGRYVGVVPEEVDENFDFEETMKEIHLDLNNLNEEAAELAEQIQRNFEELGI